MSSVLALSSSPSNPYYSVLQKKGGSPKKRYYFQENNCPNCPATVQLNPFTKFANFLKTRLGLVCATALGAAAGTCLVVYKLAHPAQRPNHLKIVEHLLKPGTAARKHFDSITGKEKARLMAYILQNPEEHPGEFLINIYHPDQTNPLKLEKTTMALSKPSEQDLKTFGLTTQGKYAHLCYISTDGKEQLFYQKARQKQGEEKYTLEPSGEKVPLGV